MCSNCIIIKSNCYTVPSFASLDRPTISQLTSLNLNFVDVIGETIEYILSNCPDLEYVRILNSPSLVGIRVAATCPKLKHLEIAHCHYLEYVDIFDTPVLTTLSYSGPRETSLRFSDAPNLTDVSLQGSYCDFYVTRFSELPLDLSLIQKLVLDAHLYLLTYHKFPKLLNVTELELLFLQAQDGDRKTSLSCTYAIQACPNLCRLSVKWYWTEEPYIRKEKKVGKKVRANRCLKVVDLWGFRGGLADTELVTYIFTKAPAVEKITVVTVNSDYLLGNIEPAGRILSVNENIHARNTASRIASQYAPTAELLIRPLNNCTAE